MRLNDVELIDAPVINLFRFERAGGRIVWSPQLRSSGGVVDIFETVAQICVFTCLLLFYARYEQPAKSEHFTSHETENPCPYSCIYTSFATLPSSKIDK